MSGIGGQANNMDSISRPTSRVLAPPGGGSSNIFGCGTEPTKEFNKNDPRYKTNNIFGASEPVPKPAAQPTTQDMQANPEPPVPAPPAQSTNSAKENNPVGVSIFFHHIKKINLLQTYCKKSFRLPVWRDQVQKFTLHLVVTAQSVSVKTCYTFPVLHFPNIS